VNLFCSLATGACPSLLCYFLMIFMISNAIPSMGLFVTLIIEQTRCFLNIDSAYASSFLTESKSEYLPVVLPKCSALTLRNIAKRLELAVSFHLFANLCLAIIHNIQTPTIIDPHILTNASRRIKTAIPVSHESRCIRESK